MAKLGINTGTAPNDGTGDTLLNASVKIKSNFDEIYSTFGDGTNLVSYANTSGVSTSVIGGIASVTQLNVSGVSTISTTNISGDLTFTGANDIYLKDSGVINIGNSNDLQIYHNGIVSVIREAGTGGLLIDSNNEIKLAKNGSGTDTLAIFTPNGSVELYYNNSKKFETTNNGVQITGIATITGNLNAAGNYYVKIARTSNQTIPTGTDTLIGFTTMSDPNGWYAGITTRTTPTVAGTYQVNAMLNWQAGATTNTAQSNVQLRKNANTFAISIVGIQTFQYSQFICGIVTMNGTTDYIDFTAYTSNPTSQAVTGDASGLYTKMEIFKIN